MASDDAIRLSAALAGRYAIERELGQGGMATVYLAYDVRHDRRVALKVLRQELAAVIGADRFLQEIRTTANLQHPHILALHDSGEVDGTVFYVMPFVEGESLRERLIREKQLPISDAVRIATEVAGALDYAHRRGVIHRDVKPENILLHERQALVADFGIALAASRTGGAGRLTGTGMSLGTPQYMSPEQAMGDTALDARSDVYALGCVLYEMLAGEPPFTGPNAQTIVAKVMTTEAEPVTTVRKSVPSHVAAAIRVALNKLPADRFSGTAELAAALSNPQFGFGVGGARSEVATAALLRRRDVLAAAALVALVGAGLGAAVTMSLRRVVATPLVAQFEMTLPDSVSAPVYGGGAAVFPTSDGRLLWTTRDALYERAVNGLTNRRLRDVPAGASLLIQDESPDGSEVLAIVSAADPPRRGEAAGARRRGTLILPLSGGPARELVDSADFAAWGPDGYVYYTYYWPQARKSGLARVPAHGGLVDTLATFELRGGALVPQNLVVLPDARALVVTLGSREAPELSAFDIRDRTWRPLGEGGPSVAYVEPGYLVYSNGSTIMAAPFDADRLALTAPARSLVDVTEPGVRFFASRNVLVYRAVGVAADAPPLAIRTRRGEIRTLPNQLSGWRFRDPVVSPDGRRFAVLGDPFQTRSASGGRGGGPPNSDVFVYELPSGPMSRLATDERELGHDWLPGGRDIGFVSLSVDTPWTYSVMRRRWDGSDAGTRLFASRNILTQARWLGDGSGMVVVHGLRSGGRGPGSQSDIGLLRFARPDSIETLAATAASESNPDLSPDDRFLAYQSNESGRQEVYVRPIAGGLRRQVSLAGGSSPRWSRSGRELFFVAGDIVRGTMTAARIRTEGELAVESLTPLFPIALSQFMPVPLPGDSLFIGYRDEAVAQATAARMVVLVNLGAALARLFSGASGVVP